MAAKPSKLPEWDTTQVNSIEPDATHKAEGWLAPGGVPEKPPFQTFNYWQNIVYRWINFLDDATTAITNVAELRAITEEPGNKNIIPLLGYYTANDGGGQMLYWDETSTETDNGFSIFKATTIATGRFKSIDISILNVRHAGAKGDGTDDYTFFDNMANSGIEIMYVPEGIFRLDTTLDLPPNVSLIGAGIGRTILDFSNANINGITSQGTTSEPSTLNANIVQGDRTITMTDASGYSDGDVIIIYNDTDFSYSPYRDVYRAGEMAIISHISGNDIETVAPTFAGYIDGANMHVYLMNPTTIVFRDFSIKGSESGVYAGVYVKNGYKCRIENVEAYEFQYTAFRFDNCMNTVLSGCDGRSIIDAAPIALNYGITIGSCQSIDIGSSYFIADRHGFTTGNGTFSFPSRYINLHDSQIFNTGRELTPATDSHGNQEYVTFDNIKTNSIRFGGNYNCIKNCIVYAALVAGISSRELSGISLTIANNQIYMYGDNYMFDAGITADMLEGGTLRFTDNQCYMFDTTGGRIPARVTKTGMVPTDVNIIFNANEFYDKSGVEQGTLAIQGTTGENYNQIEFKDNILEGYSAAFENADYFTIAENTVKDGGNDLSLIIRVLSPAVSTQIIKVTNNILTRNEGTGLAIIAGDGTFKCKELVVTGNVCKDNANSVGTRYELDISYAEHAVVRENVLSGVIVNLTGLVNIDNIDEIEYWDNTHDTTLLNAITHSNTTIFRGQIDVNLADDGEHVIPENPNGFVKAWTAAEVLYGTAYSSGSVGIIYNTAQATNADTDTFLCVYDKGTTIGVRNRLGAQNFVHIIVDV